MNSRRKYLPAVCLLLLSPVLAADEVGDLAVLCATQCESTEFDERWAAWVADNFQPGMDLDGVIEDLLKRADRYRWSRHSSTGGLSWSAQTRQRIRQNLQVTAARTIKQQVARNSD